MEAHVLLLPDRARETLEAMAAEDDSFAAELLNAVHWAFIDCRSGRLVCLGCHERIVSADNVLPVVAVGDRGVFAHAAYCGECYGAAAFVEDPLIRAADSLLRRSARQAAVRSVSGFHCEQVGHA
jgi:hypothetical protein